ncbi:MAG: histidine kinase N-terminal 7TM domain-containing protein [Anaerolineae bacterium]
MARLVVAVLGWLTLNVLELIAHSPQATLLWAQLTYFFIPTTALAWIAFALCYAGNVRWLAPRRFLWLCIIPAATIVLALTNQWHHLIWAEYEFVPVDSLLTMRIVTYGGWFVVQTSYAYLLVLWGSALIARQYLRTFYLYRQQSILVLIGALMPIAVNLIYLLRLVPGLRKDFTSISFALASITFTVGIFRYRLFDLGPIARSIVVNNMADMMITLDARGRVVDLNPAACRLLAHLDASADDEQWIGKTVAQLPEPWPSLVAGSPTAGQGEMDVAFDMEGQRRYYDVQASPLVDGQERLAGRILVLREVTARKQTEERLKEYAHELEVQNKELDTFAYMVAHDLKNPVTVLVSYAEWLRDSYSNLSLLEVGETLKELSRSGQKIASMIDDLLLLARLRHLDEIMLEPLLMGRVVSAAQARLGPEWTACQARITAPETWPMVMGYAPWVEEVWTNYLSNALKYGGRPDESIEPCIEVGFDEGHGLGDGYVRFWVRDNGPGLTPEEQALLFSEFTRLAETRARGYGLGLAIVRRIIEKLGGQVGVESQRGQGSTFWFTLPRNSAREVATTNENRSLLPQPASLEAQGEREGAAAGDRVL